MKEYFIYIMANASRMTYVGVTNNVERRAWQHRQREGDSFTAQYGLTLLVHIEEFANVNDAIAREKQLKGWTKAKKRALIERANPDWLDLSAEWR
ncbi:MAG: GIY-YIG nuclease family protein [Thermomicrobiales bacterium]